MHIFVYKGAVLREDRDERCACASVCLRARACLRLSRVRGGARNLGAHTLVHVHVPMRRVEARRGGERSGTSA